jgi:O-antigen/teichoic acid export membrane protein
VADQAVASFTNLATLVIIGRSCSKEQLGLYALAFVVFAGAVEVQASLISTPYTVHRPRLSPDEGREFLGATLLFQFAFSLLAMAFIGAVGALLGILEGFGAVADVMKVLGLTVAFMLLKEHLRRVCFAGLRMRSAAALDASAGLIQVSALLVLAGGGMLSADTALGVIAASSGAAALAWLVRNRDHYQVTVGRAAGRIRAMWKQGRWMTASGLLSIIAAQLYPWLLTAMHGAAATALWAACWSLTSIVNPLVLALTNYLGPAAATTYAVGGARRLRSMLRNVSTLFTLSMGLFCIGAVALGARVVATVYGSGYAHDGLVISLLALNVIPVGLSVISSRGLFAIERADVDFRINLVPAAVGFTAGLFLTYAYGVEGAAAALLAGNTLAAAARYRSFAALTADPSSGRAAT